ncbi:PucR family transcriptional regulator ligand-binding domain-containing protein [Leucobacter weissii]|uniref:PucR family transcriptional regulator ligand-binding domain-containing protein n=1 Tax=Leucobacter weissii TaxID=1983706 RepID=A0A939S9E7_9MICO|nr:helix-turn-helix domain-containing protein [Leucobacter weissii]MBO1900852.1 PucR family transcriptional regulator ligand-binding domain-containing protein [Leucobacter weissii]
MTFTVKSLLDLPEARTVSLTPGVGEERLITWAHVCELPEPWRWLGAGALLMTTGLPLPPDAEQQREYFRGVHAGGIAAITIDETMPEVELHASALDDAARIGLPVLQTAHEVPFVQLSMAVARAAQQDRVRRIRQAERMYAILRTRATDRTVDLLLAELGRVLGGELSLHRGAERGVDRKPVERVSRGVLTAVVPAETETELRFSGALDIDPSLLLHAASIVGSALAVEEAARHSDWRHGSLLLGELCDETLPAENAGDLVAAYGLRTPFVLAAAQAAEPEALLASVHTAFAADGVPALVTVKDHQLLLLGNAGEAVDDVFDAIARAGARLGVSEHFDALQELPTALRQARSALIRNHEPGLVMRFEEHETSSLFLPNDPAQLRGIARQVLGPLQTYDRQRGTKLTHTLRVFLEENRSWVRAAERLYVHRQTLIARISRIEKIIDRDLSSMEDAAECWLAIQAAIGSGELDPGVAARRADTAPHPSETEET